MKNITKQILAALLLLMAGVQQAWAQKVVLYTTDNGAVELDFADIDSITFSQGSVAEDKWVDLGLPSGTLWATCNLGAESPEDYGYYFAWGETEPKSNYTWGTYKWMTAGQDDWSYINKYTFADGQTNACWYSGGQFVGDNKQELDPEDDAAKALWGSDWQIPSIDQIYELLHGDYTKAEWTTQNGVYGRKVTSKKNGNSIFLPAAGWRSGASLAGGGTTGYYWSNSLGGLTADYAFPLNFSSDYWGVEHHDRFCGHPIRPVHVVTLVSEIVLSKEELTLKPGDVHRLMATVSPSDASNKAVKWESSNASVATVNYNGYVTAVSTGFCIITCTAKDGSGVYAQCGINVVQPVTDITLNQTSLSLLPGDVLMLSATVSPANASNKKLTWSSSNTSVATVDQSGIVTAVAVGDCTITASATDGSGTKAECAVSVIRLVTGIALSPTSLSLEPGSVEYINCAVYPSDATNKQVTWSSSDTSVATVNEEGKVTAVAVGTCNVTCSATDGSGIKADCIVTVFQPVTITSITLNHDRLSLSSGESETLSATILPANATNKNITWSSNKTNVATVDQTGKVKAVAGGICTITCSATDDSGVCALCYVSVYEEHEYVDLGLPSGTLWATCNVGASSPEEYGDYFAWGETLPKNKYESDNYKYFFCDVNDNQGYTKYCLNSSCGYNGYTDDLEELEWADDAASVNWTDNEWQTPSERQFAELLNSKFTTTELSTRNGIKGLLVKSRSTNKSIFLPASFEEGFYDSYWTRSLYSDYTPLNIAYELRLFYNKKGEDFSFFLSKSSRNEGYRIRPVLVKKVIRENDYVDLGLPSGTLWATRNVGASSPEEYGDYFAWGHIRPNDYLAFDWFEYKYCDGTENTMTKYCTDSEYGTVDNKTVLDPKDDAATANLSDDWQMPSIEQIKELINSNYTTTELTTLNGVEGRMITSKVNGKSIFLPAAGICGERGPAETSFYGEYWSRSLCPSIPNRAYDLSSHSNINVVEWVADLRYVGRSVRPVHK